LEEAERNPDVDCRDVEILTEEAVQEGAHDGSLCEDEDFEGVGVFSGLKVSLGTRSALVDA
jgi:hypothetical protein